MVTARPKRRRKDYKVLTKILRSSDRWKDCAINTNIKLSDGRERNDQAQFSKS